MTKEQINELHKLSLKDKIKIVHDLWDDIAEKQSLETLSSEHQEILEKRLQLIESGNAKFRPWSDIVAKYKLR